jgi:GTP cyclohydrolase I (EC 3.5.4.16)
VAGILDLLGGGIYDKRRFFATRVARFSGYCCFSEILFPGKVPMADRPFFESKESFLGSLADEGEGPQEVSGSEAPEGSGSGLGAPSGTVGSAVDLARIERAVREILLAVGEDPDREGLRDTPVRVARMYAELFSGLREDPRIHLQKFFLEKYDEIVLIRNISFHSLCEHHLLPFMGHAHIGYIPDGRVVGLSKLARVVESVAHRPQCRTDDRADRGSIDPGAQGQGGGVV